jgi:hypothetical protein
VPTRRVGCSRLEVEGPLHFFARSACDRKPYCITGGSLAPDRVKGPRPVAAALPPCRAVAATGREAAVHGSAFLPARRAAWVANGRYVAGPGAIRHPIGSVAGAAQDLAVPSDAVIGKSGASGPISRQASFVFKHCVLSRGQPGIALARSIGGTSCAKAEGRSIGTERRCPNLRDARDDCQMTAR